MFVLVLCNANGQTTYYVDQTNGSDTANGTTPALAWKTISEVNAHSFQPGDSILFKRGEIWKGEKLTIEGISGAVNNPITFGAYGVGAKPIISAIVEHPHSWVVVDTNIWKATNPPIYHPQRLLMNGIEQLRANNYSEIDGTFVWWYDTSANEFYVHSTSDPSNVVLEYSAESIVPVILGWTENITLSNLDLWGGWTSIFVNTLSKNITLDSLKIGKYSREGVVISGGSMSSEYPDSIIISKCDFDANFTLDYSSSTVYPGNSDRGCSDGIRVSKMTSGTIRDCTFKNWGHASIDIVGVDVTNVKVHDNYLTSPDICYGGRIAVDNASNIEVFNNRIYNTSITSQLNGEDNHYHHNIFSETKDSPLRNEVNFAVGIQAYSVTEVRGNVFENNLILNTEGAGFHISGNNSMDVYDNVFRNNIVYNCGTLINGESVVVQENLFQSTLDNSFQNNLILNEQHTNTCYFRDSLYDVAGFEQQSGSDGYLIENNIVANPFWYDPANEDYHLMANSPCIDAGTAALAQVDFGGDPIPFGSSITDIGLHEYQYPPWGVSEIDASGLNIYPNPTSGTVVLETGQKKIDRLRLFNSFGSLIMEMDNAPNVLDLSSMNPGIYILECNVDGEVIRKKVIVQH